VVKALFASSALSDVEVEGEGEVAASASAPAARRVGRLTGRLLVGVVGRLPEHA
jgi:hypothetical protein